VNRVRVVRSWSLFLVGTQYSFFSFLLLLLGTEYGGLWGFWDVAWGGGLLFLCQGSYCVSFLIGAVACGSILGGLERQKWRCVDWWGAALWFGGFLLGMNFVGMSLGGLWFLVRFGWALGIVRGLGLAFAVGAGWAFSGWFDFESDLFCICLIGMRFTRLLVVVGLSFFRRVAG